MTKQESWKPEGVPEDMSVSDYLDRLTRWLREKHLDVGGIPKKSAKKKTKKEGLEDLF